MEGEEATVDTEEGIDSLDDVVRGPQVVRRGTSHGQTTH